MRDEKKLIEVLAKSSWLSTKITPEISKFMHFIWDNDRLKREVLG